MPHFKKIPVGKYSDGNDAYLGDVVNYNEESNWFIGYRYGEIMLKQVGMMAMIGLVGFKEGDFSKVKKTNIFGAGVDWLIVGYSDEPIFDKIKNVAPDMIPEFDKTENVFPYTEDDMANDVR